MLETIFDVDCNQYNTSFIPDPDNVFFLYTNNLFIFQNVYTFHENILYIFVLPTDLFSDFFFITFVYLLSYKINKNYVFIK